MTPVSPARRRAEEFASLLEGRGGDSRQFGEQIDMVALLRSVSAPVPSPDYVRELRAGLMAAADTLLVPAADPLALTPRKESSRRRDRRLAIAATTLAVLGGSTGVAFASQSALPGDTLYPIKRIVESARTSLSADDQARADRIMGLAEGRLDEAQALALRDSAESQAAIPTALADFVAQASQAADSLLGEYADTGDTESVSDLRDFTRESLDVLAGLKSLVPAEYADDFDAAVNALLSIDERALAACPDCGGLLDIPAILLSGAPIDSSTSQRPVLAPKAETAEPKQASDPIAALLNQLPAIGSTTTKEPTGTAAGPTASASPSGPLSGTGGSLDGTLDPSTTSGPLTTGTVGDLLNPLLAPLLGSDGLL